MPLHMGFLIYYPTFPPLFSYEENSKNSSSHIFLQVFAYKYHKDLMVINKLKINGFKNLEGLKSTVSGNMLGENHLLAHPRRRAQPL